MKTVQIGNSSVHPIGLGTWHLGDHVKNMDREKEAVWSALEAGMQVIDTAEMYGPGRSEFLLGQALKEHRREDYYMISKVLPGNASLAKMPKSLDHTMKRLKTDYLDLYLLHWLGESVPLEESVEALEKARQEGKILNWGVSNFDVKEMEVLYDLPHGKNCATNQVMYNLGCRGIEFDLLPWMRAHDLPLMAYSPLAQGDKLGNDFLKQPLLQEMAERHGASIFQLLLAWSVRDGKTIAIPQSRKVPHIQENAAAADIALNDEDLAILDSLYPAPDSKQPLAVL